MNSSKSYSDKYCCVPGCLSTLEDKKTVLHGFPNPTKNRELFNTWLYKIGGDILSLTSEHVYKYRRVCHCHFEDKYLMRFNRISNIAVPTLNMPDVLEKMKETNFGKVAMKSTLITNQPSTSKDQNLCCQGASKIDRVIPVPPSLRTYSGPVQKQLIAPRQIEHNLATLPLNEQSMRSEFLQDTEIIPREDVAMPTVVHEDLTSVLSNVCLTDTKKQQLSEVFKRTRRVNLSKSEKQLHSKLVAAKIKISRMKNKMRKQMKAIKTVKKLASDPTIFDSIENCSTTAKMLMKIQLRESKKSNKGRRFSLEEKLIALSIFKQSPKGYRFFRKIFIMPAPQTLMKLIQNSNLKPGLNKNIFSQLKKRAAEMTLTEKLCILMFDEVSLKANINYNSRKDDVTGFVDTGKEKMPEYADHAQVFMVRGLINNYKQPVAYTFSSSATKGAELAVQIKDIIASLIEAGMIVVATVCDQGTNNVNAIKSLINECRGDYLRRGETLNKNIFTINGNEIIPIYDPPHLLKGIRNNLLTKNLKYNDGVDKVAKWSHLQLLNKENPGYRGIKMLPKLTDHHVNPDKMNKMKVKLASQIFSRTVASNMGYLADKKILPEESKGTADFFLIMDNLFDSVNGSFKRNRNAKPLLGPATIQSPHIKEWNKIKKVLKSAKFVTRDGAAKSVPSLINWIWTLDNLELLLKTIHQKYNVSSIWMRHLNQDPLENFFGSIRSHGCRNVNPTCDQFQSAFATLLVNSLSSVNATARGKNCEDDYCNALHAFVIEDNPEPPFTCVISQEMLQIEFVDLTEKEKSPTIIAALQYVSGYFLKKAKDNIFKGCETCKNHFTTSDELEYIKYREYKGKRWLCYPSHNLIEIISNMQDTINYILKTNFENRNLHATIKTVIMVIINFNFIQCIDHKDKVIEYLIKIVVNFFIHTQCKIINSILTGGKSSIDDQDIFQLKALRYNKKCYKRKK